MKVTGGPPCGGAAFTGIVATFWVAKLTLQTRKLWLVGVATDHNARFLLTCPKTMKNENQKMKKNGKNTKKRKTKKLNPGPFKSHSALQASYLLFFSMMVVVLWLFSRRVSPDCASFHTGIWSVCSLLAQGIPWL